MCNVHLRFNQWNKRWFDFFVQQGGPIDIREPRVFFDGFGVICSES